MDVTKIIAQLTAERDRIDAAIKALSGFTPTTGKRRGRPPLSAKAPATAKPKKRKMSAEGRARIAAAQKKRWAAQKKAAKASA